jgi:hypothetical protein
MNKHFRFTAIFGVCALVQCAVTWAQQDEPALPASAEAEEKAQDAPASQEVEINEDNYRQFMELKDGLQQRTVLPENSYQSQAGLQKLDKLPEESQKHLRNQLREIIMQRGPWQPGDEDGEYPYVPSGAAQADGALQKQEAEAWGELVDHYHAREADIYAGSPRARAAGGPGGNAATAGNEGPSSEGQDEEGQGKEGQGQEGQEGTADSADKHRSSSPDSTEGGYSPNSASDPSADNAEGVSQNAMEFLMQSGNLGADTRQNSAGSADASDGQVGEQELVPQEQAAQQNAAEQGQVQNQRPTQTQAQTISASAMQNTEDQAATESTVGTSQNALEYLVGKDVKPETGTGDTLSIEDLANARGISVEPGTGSPVGNLGKEETPDKDKPKKDGGG